MYSHKDTTNINKITKTSCEIMYNAENITLQSFQILFTFVLRIQIVTTFGPKMVTNDALYKSEQENVPNAFNICNPVLQFHKFL